MNMVMRAEEGRAFRVPGVPAVHSGCDTGWQCLRAFKRSALHHSPPRTCCGVGVLVEFGEIYWVSSALVPYAQDQSDVGRFAGQVWQRIR